MTNEEMQAMLDLGQLVETLARTAMDLDDRLSALERRADQSIPRNEYNMSPTDAEFFQRVTHSLKHDDCPLVKGEPCRWLERDFVSFNIMDVAPLIKNVIKRLDAVEFLMPPKERATIRQIMSNENDGVAL